MNSKFPVFTAENAALTKKLEKLNLEFLDLYTRHKEMVEDEGPLLESLYLEKLGRLQLELLEKQTEASRLKMRMNMIQAAINRDEKPDLKSIDAEISNRLEEYYTRIMEQSAALDEAKKILAAFLTGEDAQKLKETFRLLCKRLHPDLNPNQGEEEKDLFIRVKAAYDLNNLHELQSILLYLDESGKEDLKSVPVNQKEERIRHLENNILILNEKITTLGQSFPYNMKEVLNNDEEMGRRQDELREQIKKAVADISRYSEIINIMCDE